MILWSTRRNKWKSSGLEPRYACWFTWSSRAAPRKQVPCLCLFLHPRNTIVKISTLNHPESPCSPAKTKDIKEQLVLEVIRQWHQNTNNIIFSLPSNHVQLEDEEGEEESYLVPSLLTDQLTIDDAVRPYDLVGGLWCYSFWECQEENYCRCITWTSPLFSPIVSFTSSPLDLLHGWYPPHCCYYSKTWPSYSY